MRAAIYTATILILAVMLAGVSSATSSSPTQVVTSYSYSTVPISTVTWTSTVGRNLASDSFPVSPPSGSFGCNIIYDQFTAPVVTISGTITASSPLDIYLLSSADYNAWNSNRVSCDGPDTYLASRSEATSYQFNINLPQAGGWYFVFFNKSKTSTANVVVSVNSAGSPVTYTTTSDSLYMQTILVTQSLSQSSSEQQLQTNSQALGQNGSSLILGIVAIIIVAFVAIGAVVMKKRSKTETRSTPAKPVPVASDMMFCRKCGARIPRDSTFCKECGEKTTKV